MVLLPFSFIAYILSGTSWRVLVPEGEGSRADLLVAAGFMMCRWSPDCSCYHFFLFFPLHRLISHASLAKGECRLRGPNRRAKPVRSCCALWCFYVLLLGVDWSISPKLHLFVVVAVHTKAARSNRSYPHPPIQVMWNELTILVCHNWLHPFQKNGNNTQHSNTFQRHFMWRLM